MLDFPAPARASFSDDGRRVAVMSNPGRETRFDAATGAPVTVSAGGVVRVFDAVTGEPIGPELRHPQGVFAAAFNPAAERLVTASEDGGARVWRVASGEQVGAAFQHDAEVTGAHYGPRVPGS